MGWPLSCPHSSGDPLSELSESVSWSEQRDQRGTLTCLAGLGSVLNIASRSRALVASSHGLNSQALSPSFAWGRKPGWRGGKMAVGAVCMSRHVSVNIQGETQATTSLQAKKSKHTGETETENKQFLELQTQTGHTTVSVWPSQALAALCLHAWGVCDSLIYTGMFTQLLLQTRPLTPANLVRPLWVTRDSFPVLLAQTNRRLGWKEIPAMVMQLARSGEEESETVGSRSTRKYSCSVCVSALCFSLGNVLRFLRSLAVNSS